jgi:DNA-binding HxlR family transcriptional regulator
MHESYEWYIISNLKEFTDKARSIVYKNFGQWSDNINKPVSIDDVEPDELEEFNRVLSHQESLLIVKQFVKKEKNKKTKKIRYILDDQIFEKIIHDLNNRMVSNILNNLVQKGLVESAFDDKVNDFVFWVKEDEKNLEKPETD